LLVRFEARTVANEDPSAHIVPTYCLLVLMLRWCAPLSLSFSPC
jgi:hypothetical protein